jgi:plasmid stabilization system protein ParE
MVKRLVWSKFAIENKVEILKYWTKRNKSDTFSTKLNKIFTVSAEQISIFPSIGKPTSEPTVKYIIVKDYLMFFEELEEEISILHIWDTRRNPEDLLFNVK